MMQLSDARRAYQELSGKASDIARQLSFVGIALVWLFRVEAGDNSTIPRTLRLTAALIVVSLSCDFLQYVVHAATWGAYARLRERHLPEDQWDKEFVAPVQLNWAPLVLFWAKILILVVAYIPLLVFLLSNVV